MKKISLLDSYVFLTRAGPANHHLKLGFQLGLQLSMQLVVNWYATAIFDTWLRQGGREDGGERRDYQAMRGKSEPSHFGKESVPFKTSRYIKKQAGKLGQSTGPGVFFLNELLLGC